MAEIIINKLVDIISLAFEECCVEGANFNVNTTAVGYQGVYTIIAVHAEGFQINVCIPEDTPNEESWDGKLAITYRGTGRLVELNQLIDEIQAAKDGKWPFKKE